MKKLFYLLSIVFILSACEDDDIVTKIDNNDNDQDTITYVGGLVIDSYVTDINTLKSMYNTDMVSYVPTNGSSKSDNNYILIENKDGQIDTLGTTDGAKITINNVYEIYTINDNYLLFERNYKVLNGTLGINVNYEILTHEYITVYDSVHVDSTTNYVNIVDTTYVNDEMWLVYYDTIDIVIDTTYETQEYWNILYNLNDGTFYDLVDNIYPYNNIITNSFNDPFYRNSDKSKFYYLNQDTKVIEVDLSNKIPTTKEIFNHTNYPCTGFEHMNIIDDNIIFKNNGIYRYVTKNGTYDTLNGDNFFVQDNSYLSHFNFILNNTLYYVFGELSSQSFKYYEVVYDENNDSIYLHWIKSTPLTEEQGMNGMNNRRYTYIFSDNDFNYYFDKGDNHIITISKNDLTFTYTTLDFYNAPHTGLNVPIELQTKMAKFINGFIIYTSENIYLINTNSKSSIISTPIPNADGYRIKDMTTDSEGNVVFYGKNKNGEYIKGVINSDNTITETLVEYDSNGTLITNLN